MFKDIVVEYQLGDWVASYDAKPGTCFGHEYRTLMEFGETKEEAYNRLVNEIMAPYNVLLRCKGEHCECGGGDLTTENWW